jgi:hypothetical protein
MAHLCLSDFDLLFLTTSSELQIVSIHIATGLTTDDGWIGLGVGIKASSTQSQTMAQRIWWIADIPLELRIGSFP